MKVPTRWLREFIDLPVTDAGELSDVLAMVGHEVEGYETLVAGWEGVVVGRVLGIEAHPDADKIRVCQVDTGSGLEQIICGAWNFEEGATVAVAKPGAVLQGGYEIGRRVIRDIESNGMICSEKELGLGEDHAGILLLDGSPQLGSDLADLVELPDVVYDLSITPNRPDAMSILGIARDLAAYFDIGYSIPGRPLVTRPGSTDVSVKIEDKDGCRRFVAREIRGVTIGPSPLWVRHRLAKVGVRAISNVVDVTNYVMFEMGHPLHAFDARSISGSELVVRRGRAGETLITLDEEERSLSDEDLIIYDAAGPTSMSGTMGGHRSEVSSRTVDVLMEAASWDPPTIMYMSRRHDLRSEASTRFERGVDPLLADLANQRAAAMVADLAGGAVLEGYVDEVGQEIEPAEIDLTVGEVTRLLGPGFSSAQVGGILARLGMDVSGDDPLHVRVPTYRPDVTRPADLIEEIARIHGFDKFESTLPLGVAGGLTVEQRRERLLYRTLAGAGLSQAVTLPFVGEADLKALGRHEEINSLVKVKNPLSDEEGRLRSTMLPNLLNALRYNISHGNKSVALFEVGSVFLADRDEDDPRLPRQPTRLAWAITGTFGILSLGESGFHSDADISLAVFRHVAGAMGIQHPHVREGSAPGMHPGRSAVVEIDGTVAGYVGELSPASARHFELSSRVAVAELDLNALLGPRGLKEAVTPSVFPFVDFDLSFLVSDELPVGDLLDAIAAAGQGLVERASVFDEFRGEGVQSGWRAVAIHYRLRAADRTLTNEDVAPVREAMIEAAASLGATLRGL
jgi:phenylalanyl-tRNA synthetase beta chain